MPNMVTSSLFAGPWARCAHLMAIENRSGRVFGQTEAVVLNSAHYWRSQPVRGFDLDFVYARYMAPDNVDEWRRRAIRLLDEQFADPQDEGVVLSFSERASLAKVQAYWCKVTIIEGHRYLEAIDRFDVKPAV